MFATRFGFGSRLSAANRHRWASFFRRNSSSSTMTSDQKFVVKRDEMHRFVVDCMAAVGAKEENGAKVADLLISADVRGHYSHGLNRLRIYMEDCRSGNCDANAQPAILRQKGATAWIDGRNGLGAVVADFCTRIAIELAAEHGVGWVVCKSSNHFGIAGFWPLLMKERGYLGMAMTNTSPLVFPTRAAQHALGTNPIAIVAPAENGDDFALDMATSAVALGKIELAERKGERINEQWGADKSGRPTDDPADITQKGGGLLPLGGCEETGGYKGAGLGMAVELCTSILGGATYGKNVRTWRETSKVADLGQCFVAVDPACFAPGFNTRLQTYMDETRQLIPADREKPVLVPGDPERKHTAESESGILYGQAQLDHLLEIAKHNNVRPFVYKPATPTRPSL
ncbi:hypothetical protein M3Y99_01065100 [Aphelenchoides fujianensis]|nr:hypothetical protein M3Y99_01065100 [Aphelenchoides fujianensis]